MKRKFVYAAMALIAVGIAAFSGRTRTAVHGQEGFQTKIVLGAYYFDGWASDKPDHLTPKLRDSFPDRKPKWGWVTSTPEVVKDQIDLAADAGLSFFSFCWYYPSYNQKNFTHDPLNHALSLYLASPNKSRLQFSLMVANHAGQQIGPEDWTAVTDEWVRLFKDPGYLKVDGKPFLTFFTVTSLIGKFGSPEAVSQAFDQLREKARQAGLAGVTIATCPSPTPEAVKQAKSVGCDFVTGYNYPTLGFKDHLMEHNVDSLSNIGSTVWDRFLPTSLPYIPVATLNWDPRPWANGTNWYSKSVHYTGYNSNSVYRSIKSLKNWISSHGSATSREHIALLYAWNEYGEGAWLTPGENDTLHLLSGVKKALSN